MYAVRNKNSREVLQGMLSILKAGLAENDQVLGNAVQQFKSEELAMDEQPMLQLMGFNTTDDHDILQLTVTLMSPVNSEPSLII